MTGITEADARNRWAWWLYVAVVCAVGYGRMIERLAKDSGGFWSQFGPPIGATALAIGIFCWLGNQRLVNVWLWRGVHACVVLAQVLAVVFAAYLAGIGVIAAAALMALLAILLIPAYIAMYRYAYRSPGLWNRTR